MATQKNWLDQNGTKMWRTAVLLYLTLVSALGAWGLTRVSEIPEKYPTKVELQCMVDQIQRTMSAGFDRQDRMAQTNGSKIDELNRYLRSDR